MKQITWLAIQTRHLAPGDLIQTLGGAPAYDVIISSFNISRTYFFFITNQHEWPINHAKFQYPNRRRFFAVPQQTGEVVQAGNPLHVQGIAIFLLILALKSSKDVLL